MAPSKNTFQRFIKFMVHLILILTFAWKACEAWQKFSKGDTMMVTKVKHPSRQTFPSVTLCRGIIVDLHQGTNFSDTIEYNLNLENWLNSSFDQVAGLDTWDRRDMSKLLTLDEIHSVCHTFIPSRKISSGIHHGLELKVQSDTSSFFYIILHDHTNNIPMFGDVFETNSVALPVITKRQPYYMIYLAISPEKTISISTKYKPCSNEPNMKQTLLNCIEEYFEVQKGCILEWNHNESSLNTEKKQMCKDSNYIHYKTFMEEIIHAASFRDIYRKTGCMPRCKLMVILKLMIKYKSALKGKRKYSYKKSIEVSLPAKTKGQNVSMHVVLYLAPSGVTLKREVLVFDTLEMIGNVGGYLGLLLGWSAMSLLQLCFKDN